MRETMSLSLTPEQSAFVNTCVETGRYQSASEVVRAGSRLLADQESKRQAELDGVRMLVREGTDAPDSDELVDGDILFETLQRENQALLNSVAKSS